MILHSGIVDQGEDKNWKWADSSLKEFVKEAGQMRIKGWKKCVCFVCFVF